MSETGQIGAGRPTAYSQEVADIICSSLIAGDSLITICNKPDMPCPATVYNWLATATREDSSSELKEFLDRYTRAREMYADAIFDQCASIADDGTNDWYEKQLRDGSTVPAFDKENVMRSKLRVDTRIVMAERLRPKKYRPSSAVDHTLSEPPQIIDDVATVLKMHGEPPCQTS